MPPTRAPYDTSTGVLVTYPDPWALRQGTVQMRPIEPFTATLTATSVERGRSSAVFYWADEQGRAWPMFLTDLLALLQTTVVDHGQVTGTWTVTKRGRNYGIALLDAEGDAQ